MFFLRNIQRQGLAGQPQMSHGQEGHTAGSFLGQERTQGFSFGVVIQRPQGALHPLRDKGRGHGTPWRETLIRVHGEEQLERQRCSGMDQGVPGKWELGKPGIAKKTAEGLWCGMRDLALSLLTPGWNLRCVCRGLG